MKQQASDSAIRSSFDESVKDAQTFSDFIKKKKYPTIPIVITKEEIDEVVVLQRKRWENAQQIKGTQKFHHFQPDPQDGDFLIVKNFSDSQSSKKVRIMKKNKSNKT